MKHLIITAIVSLGLVAQSGTVSIEQQTHNGQAVAVVGSSPGDGSQQLSAQETRNAIGGENLTGCWAYMDAEGDIRGICCLDLWIIRICVDVNLSELKEFLGL